jgi:glycosyltransferase involved in cell wall biosynthesis
MYKKISLDQTSTININGDINSIVHIFTANHHETIFVIDSEWHLYGIITMGDFFRKATIAKNIGELLNGNYKKIEVDFSKKIDSIHIDNIANEIFTAMPMILKIPVINNGKLLHVIDREKVNVENNNFFLNCERIINLTSYDSDAKKKIEKPLVRVTVVTYNHIKFIKCCLNGILMQKTDFPFEIHIYDDCSTDGTSDIICEYAKKYPNIIADIQSENLYSKDKKLLLKKLFQNSKKHNCKYTAYTEGDDYWTDPYKLQVQVDFLENNLDFSMCSGGFMRSDNFNNERQLLYLANNEYSMGFEYDFSYVCQDRAINFTRMYRTEALPEYETSLKYEYFIDVHLAYYTLTKGRGYYFSRIFGVYNVHEGGVWSKLNLCEKVMLTYRVYKEIYRETQDKQVGDIFLREFNNYVVNFLKPEEHISFYKEFIETFSPSSYSSH